MLDDEHEFFMGRREFLGAALGAGSLVCGGRLSAATSAVGTVAPRHTSDTTLALGPTQPTSWAKNDTNASIDQDAAGDTWMILGGTEWSIYKGRSLDHLDLQHTYTPNFPRPHGDDSYWSSGLWIDRTDGLWYCAVHCEYNYGAYAGKRASQDHWSPDHRRRMVLVTSTDQGKSWSLVGDILTGAHPDDPTYYTGDYYDKGCGDAHIYIDEHFFYAFHRTGWFQKSSGRFYETVRAARCAKRDRMQPGTWHKWYQGGWTEPGLGGHDTDVFNANTGDTAYVFRSRKLGLYVALIGAGDIDDPQGFLSTCTDLSAQNWTTPIQYCDAATHEYYNWGVDPTTLSRHVMSGDTFRYYTSKNTAPVWHEARFVAAAGNLVTKDPLYPPQSVDDRNPGWDRNYHSPR